MSLQTIFLFAAAVCFGLATFGFSVSKVNLTALGLLFWVLTLLVK